MNYVFEKLLIVLLSLICMLCFKAVSANTIASNVITASSDSIDGIGSIDEQISFIFKKLEASDYHKMDSKELFGYEHKLYHFTKSHASEEWLRNISDIGFNEVYWHDDELFWKKEFANYEILLSLKGVNIEKELANGDVVNGYLSVLHVDDIDNNLDKQSNIHIDSAATSDFLSSNKKYSFLPNNVKKIFSQSSNDHEQGIYELANTKQEQELVSNLHKSVWINQYIHTDEDGLISIWQNKTKNLEFLYVFIERILGKSYVYLNRQEMLNVRGLR